VTSVLTYLRLLLWGWVGVVLLASGVCSLLARAFNVNVPRRLFLWVAWVLLIVAGYQAWESEHREVERLARATPPAVRQLTEAQKKALAQSLARLPHHSVEIKTSLGSSDGSAYADDFAEVFQSVGWDVVRTGAYLDPPVFGLSLRADLSDPAAGVFAQTLANIGGGIAWGYTVDLPSNRWEFIVGEKRVQP
jgi:uncharacterized membrane protein YfcA